MYRRILLIAFTVVGVTSVVTQTLFIRELEQIFYGNELCLGVIFGGWLFFSGLGSIIGRKIKRIIFLELQISLSLILPIEFFLVHSVKSALKIGPGELISPVSTIAISFTIFAPLSLVLGLLFVQGCKWWASETKSHVHGVNRVYILDAAGDMTGGFIFAYLLIWLFSLTTLFIVAFLNLVIAFILATRFKRWLHKYIFGLAGLSLLGLGFSKRLEEFSMKCDYPAYEIVNYKRSIYGNLVLIKMGSLYSLYQNGVLSFSYPNPLRAEETVHFPFLEVKEPKRILVLGGNVELIGEILKYPVQEVHYVELNSKIVDAGEHWIDFSSLNDPRVKISWEDERGFVKKYCGEKFDIAIINTGDPHTSFLNRFYTLEFFEELKDVLNPDGVVALQISSNPNYLSPELKEYNGTIYKTLKKVFPQIILVPGEELKLFGSQMSEWLTENPDTLASRIRVPTSYVTKYYLPYEFYEERINYIRGLLDKFTPTILNTDWRPISYYYNIIITSSYFSQWLKRVFVFFSCIPSWVVLLVICSIFIFVGFTVRAPVLSMGILGSTGIGTQLLLILAFEVLYGYVYHKIGIITGGFMFGVALGARIGEKKRRRLSIIVGRILIYVGFLFLIIKWLSCRTLWGAEFIFYLLPIVGGTLTGSAWTSANRQLISHGESAEQSSGLLNGVDLFGSCAGSFFLSVFFIPIYGVYFSICLLGILNFIALIFLLRNGG